MIQINTECGINPESLRLQQLELMETFEAIVEFKQKLIYITI